MALCLNANGSLMSSRGVLTMQQIKKDSVCHVGDIHVIMR